MPRLPGQIRCCCRCSKRAQAGPKARLTALLPDRPRPPAGSSGRHYWELKAPPGNLEPGPRCDAFLQRWRGTYQEDRLRNDWLLLLGQRRQWSEFARMHGRFRMQDDKRGALLRLGHCQPSKAASPSTPARGGAQLWLAQRANDDGCTYAASALYAAEQLAALAVWQRARLGAERNQLSTARNALTIVARQHVDALAGLFISPQAYLGNPKTAPPPALATLALVRMASSDPDQAANLLDTAGLPSCGPKSVTGSGASSARSPPARLDSNAVAYFDQVASRDRMSDESQDWMVRANLRAGQWHTVRKTIDAMPPALQARQRLGVLEGPGPAERPPRQRGRARRSPGACCRALPA